MIITHTLQNGNRVSSIGATWPIGYDRPNSRLKGISTTEVRNRSKLSELFEQARAVEREHPRATRTVFRAFVDIPLYGEIRNERGLEYPIEAVVPAQNAVPGCFLVYFGKNKPSRMPTQRLRARENAELLDVLGKVRPVSYQQATERTLVGYHISSLGSPSALDITDMINLYKEAYSLYTFDVNEQTIQCMIGNGNRVLVARHKDGDFKDRIASVLIAEQATIEMTDTRPVNLIELSDFATYKRARGGGLITALQHEAIRILRGIENGIESIIYTEDRAPWYAVNKSSREAGLEYCGTVLFQCRIISDRSIAYTGDMENLNVFYVPFEKP